MPRKSPYKHKVRNHIRSGKPVINYQRGKGEQKKINNIIKNYSHGGGSYNVSIFYDSGSEKLTIPAVTPISALDMGIELRKQSNIPKRLVIRRGQK